MLSYAIPMLLFTLLVAVLAGTVLVVRRRLTLRRPVTITVNGQRRLDVLSGESLLATLSSAGIHLPAACGGRGTCGQCRVQLIEGGGGLLPTETQHVSRRDAAAGFRLACMLRVRENLVVQVPADVLEAGRWRCRVVQNRNLSTYLTELNLVLPGEERLAFEAGDYVLLEAPAGLVRYRDFDIEADYRGEWERLGLFRHEVAIPEPTTRAYSLGNPPVESEVIKLIVRIALPPVVAPPDTPPGKVSSYVFGLRPGDEVSVSGPFGEFHAQQTDREMILIGGGAGIAPLRAIVRDQLIGRNSRRRISLWYGCRNELELVYADEFRALEAGHENFSYHVSLSDPGAGSDWDGPTGFIHSHAYETYLKNHPSPEAAEYYLCGPPVMSSAVLAMLEDLGVDRESVYFDDFGSQTKG
ncbi:MAG TPA: NADH:ubiquinone reductase (Na(+)-transporting) subunit F [Pseudomonadales bacterium]